jgi:hypothetical protein
VLRYVAGLVAAVLVTAAASVVAPGPAEAATCSSASGVSVVVDFHQLGGGVQSDCDASGAGKYADAQFADVGHTLTYVQRQPGFVCRVDGAPSSDPCVNTPPSDAYWSLWWSDGKSGTWKYSSTGVGSLKVPAGGYVALSWQQGSSKAKPGVAPTAHSSASPSPSASPSQSPSHSSSSSPSHSPSHPRTHHAGQAPVTSPTGPATTAGSSSAPRSKSDSPSASESKTHGQGRAQAHASKSPRASRSHAPDQTQADQPLDRSAAATSDTSSGSGSGLPGWVAPAAVILLFAAAGSVAVVRRRRSGGA